MNEPATDKDKVVDISNGQIPGWVIVAMKRIASGWLRFGGVETKSQAEDVVQDVLTKALEKPDKFTTPWQLLAATKFVAMEYNKRSHTEAKYREYTGLHDHCEWDGKREGEGDTIDEHEMSRTTMVLPHMCNDTEEHLDIEAALMALPPKLYDTILLFVVWGYTTKEIAKQQRLKEQTVRENLVKARKGMQRWAAV